MNCERQEAKVARPLQGSHIPKMMETTTNNLAELDLCDGQSTSTDNSCDSAIKNGKKPRGGGGGGGLSSRIPRPRTSYTPGSRGTYSSDADLPPRSMSPSGSIEYRDESVSDSSSFTTENGRSTPLSPGGTARKPIKSKIQSFSNFKHAPTGGKVQIFSQKVDFTDVSSRCRSKENMKHRPGGGNIQVFDEKLEYKESVQSKVGSFKNAKHVAGGGDKKIDNRELHWDVQSKVGSWKNVKHKPGGGKVQIENQNVNWEVDSRVGSWKNFRHKAGGGDVQIVDEKLTWDVGARTQHRFVPKKKPGYGYQESQEEIEGEEDNSMSEVPLETDLDAEVAAAMH